MGSPQSKQTGEQQEVGRGGAHHQVEASRPRRAVLQPRPPSYDTAWTTRYPYSNHRHHHHEHPFHNGPPPYPTRTSEFELLSPVSDLSDPSARKPPNPNPSLHHHQPQNQEQQQRRRVLVLENAPPPPHQSRSRMRLGVQQQRPPTTHHQQQQHPSKLGGLRQKAKRFVSACLPHNNDKKSQLTVDDDNNNDDNDKENQRPLMSRTKGKAAAALQQQEAKALKKSQKNTAARPPRRPKPSSTTKNQNSTHNHPHNKLEWRRRSAQFEPAWREHKGMVPSPEYYSQEDDDDHDDIIDTPHQTLDVAFAAAMGHVLHQEDDYFDRLAVENQSPFVSSKYHMADTPNDKDVYLDSDDDEPSLCLREEVEPTLLPMTHVEEDSVTNRPARVSAESNEKELDGETEPADHNSVAVESAKSIAEAERFHRDFHESASSTPVEAPRTAKSNDNVLLSPAEASHVTASTSSTAGTQGQTSDISRKSMSHSSADIRPKVHGLFSPSEASHVTASTSSTSGSRGPKSITSGKRTTPPSAEATPKVHGLLSPAEASQVTASTTSTAGSRVPTRVPKSTISRNSEPKLHELFSPAEASHVTASTSSTAGSRANVNNNDSQNGASTEGKFKTHVATSPAEASHVSVSTSSTTGSRGQRSAISTKSSPHTTTAERKPKKVRGPMLAAMLTETRIPVPKAQMVADLKSHSAEEASISPTDDMSLRVTESAPSVLETRDYRNIALAKDSLSQRKASSQVNEGAVVRQQSNPLMSPSADSICSSVGASPVPMVSNQALYNAAFLFSPSYVGGKPLKIQNAGPPKREHAPVISTTQSRSRLSTVSSRSLPPFRIPISSAPTAPFSSDIQKQITTCQKETYGKRVRFSDVKDVTVLHDGRTSHFVEPIADQGIQSKVSDLSDATGVESLVSVQEEDTEEETVAVAAIASPEEEPESAKCESSSTESKNSIRWTYRMENGTLSAATPVLTKKGSDDAGGVATTRSPYRRFQAAKTKFAKPAEKKSPARKSPPKKVGARSSTTGVVSNRVTEIQGRLRSNRQIVRKNPRRETSGENVLAPRQTNLVNPLFRNPVIMSYRTNESQPDDSFAPSDESRQKTQQQQSHQVHIADDSLAPLDEGREPVWKQKHPETRPDDPMAPLNRGKEPSRRTTDEPHKDRDASSMMALDESTLLEYSSSFATTECESPFNDMSRMEPLLSSHIDDESALQSDDEDPFADILKGRPSVGSSTTSISTVSNVRRKLSLGASARSISSEASHTIGVVSHSSTEDDESEAPTVPTVVRRRTIGSSLGGSLRSLASEVASVPTVVADKENTPNSNYLSFANKVQVNPCEQRHHAPPGSLCLSPTQRTPMQARKWRTLAAAAQEKDRKKKSGPFRRSTQSLKERNSNIPTSSHHAY